VKFFDRNCGFLDLFVSVVVVVDPTELEGSIVLNRSVLLSAIELVDGDVGDGR
jgi:hypothetical protein